MKKTALIFVIFFISIIFCKPVMAESSDTADQPWERFSFKLGWYFATLDSSVRLGSERLGVGVEIDVEETLDMETSMSVFKAETLYRFGSTNRHQFGLSYHDFRRDAVKRIGKKSNGKEKRIQSALLLKVISISRFSRHPMATRFSRTIVSALVEVWGCL